MAEADLPQSSTPHPMTLDITPPKEADLPQSSTPQPVTLNGSTPEVVPAENVAAKKPRKPRAPKGTPRLVAKLATVSENSTPGPSIDVADVELRPSKVPQLPLEFWAGLMQTQKVIMAKRKSDHYNSFRIV